MYLILNVQLIVWKEILHSAWEKSSFGIKYLLLKFENDRLDLADNVRTYFTTEADTIFLDKSGCHLPSM